MKTWIRGRLIAGLLKRASRSKGPMQVSPGEYKALYELITEEPPLYETPNWNMPA